MTGDTASRPVIMVVDDNTDLLGTLSEHFAKAYRVLTASSGLASHELIRTRSDVAAVVMDIRMPGMDGREAARHIRHERPDVSVIYLTAHAREYLESEIRRQDLPTDYIVKDENAWRRLETSLDEAVRIHRLRCGEPMLPDMMASRHGLVGCSDAMRQVHYKIGVAARCADKVLVRGESGTGKELVVRAIHDSGVRRDGPWIFCACSAKSADQAESELFGHTRGAFTGAADRKGLFALANGGTLFLDDVENIDVENQAKLLRVLEDGRFRPIGSDTTKTSDARIVSATNADLDAMLNSGDFRRDLYYRLSEIRIDLPALRDRREDIPLLVEHFNRQVSLEIGREPKVFAPEAVARLGASDWPGNVRQLKTAVRRIVREVPSDYIVASDCDSAEVRSQPEMNGSTAEMTLKDATEELSRRMITEALLRSDGNYALAARDLGLDPSNLRRKAKALGIRLQSK